MPRSETLDSARALAEDLSFSYVAAWKEATGGKAIGHFPVYAPQEVIHATGCLPVGVMGAGGLLEVDYADSRMQSFVCSVSRSTLEMGLRGNTQVLDGMVFTDICDVARNLSGVWTRNFPDMMVDYVHLPQNVVSGASVPYLERELDRFRRRLSDLVGAEASDADLRDSIALYNRERALIQRIYEVRRKAPWLLPAHDAYLLVRAAAHMPVEAYLEYAEEAVRDVESRGAKARDNIRVLLVGSFCEQPPLDLLRIVEEAGCYIVDDELLPGYRWFTAPVEVNGHPLRALAESYLARARLSSVRFPERRRGDALLDWLKGSQAEGVIFATAKFCEPALYDYILYKEALEAADVPYLHLEFEEKMTGFDGARMQVETFVESILFA